MKKTKRKRLETKLTNTFQLYIRHRDDWKCITCGKKIPNDTMNMHAGHYISRRYKSLLWNEYNVNAQCRSCNALENWKPDFKNKYAIALISKYGEKILEYLEEAKNKIYKPSLQEVEDLLKKYETLLDDKQI